MSNSEITIVFSAPAEDGPGDAPYGTGPVRPAAPARVVPTGSAAFRLVPDAKGYLLPDVALEQTGPAMHLQATLPAQVEVLDPDGMPVPAPLAAALTRPWSTAAPVTATVDGLLRISHGDRVPVGLLFPPAEDPVRLTLRWTVAYRRTGTRPDDGLVASASASVVLEFWPPGRPLPSEPRAVPEYLPLRAADTVAGDGWIAAVDFGSTASTVTLVLDVNPSGLVDPGQHRVLARELRGLAAPDESVPKAWHEQLKRLREQYLELGGLGGVRVTGEALLTRLDDPAATARLLLWIEHLRGQSRDPELRAWLADRVHRAVTAAVATPPLAFNQLGPVEFTPIEGGSSTMAPPSELRDYPPDGNDVQVSQHGGKGYALAPEGQGTWRGLKRRLLNPAGPTDLPDGPPTVHLTQHLLYLLIKRAEQQRHGSASGRAPHLGKVLLTYPTSAFPEARAKLRTLVQRGLGIADVQLTVDEGLAAGLYFLMRDLTANLDLGLEKLRASSRPVVGVAGGWMRTMLVVDIGGGTTDIALLEFVLRDRTHPLEPAEAFVSGRNYELEPRVLGTIGDRQLGGDLLTLHVFYWLKARLFDVLHQHLMAVGLTPGQLGADSDGLSALVAREVSGHPYTIVRPEVGQVLRRAVPTHVRERGVDLPLKENARAARLEAFATLWRVAERVKRALGGDPETEIQEDGDDLLFPDPELKSLLERIDKQLTDRPEIRLPKEELRLLITPPLRQVASMAAGLVGDAFKRRTEEEPILDQVVLCGRSSAMPLVRQTLTERLTETLPGNDRTPGWDPSRLTSESGFLTKQATSIGAAWLSDMQARVGVNLAGAGPLPRSELAFLPRGLLSSLPCDFVVRAMAGGSNQPLFHSGTYYEQLDASGTLGLVSGWRRVLRQAQIIRPRHGTNDLTWATSDIQQRAEWAGCDLRTPVWDFDGQPAMQIRFVVDERLTFAVEFCHGGREHYALPDRTGLEQGTFLRLMEHDLPGIRLGERPADGTVRMDAPVIASPHEWGSAGYAPTELFPAGANHGEQTLLSYFEELFHIGDQPDPLVEPTPGRFTTMDLGPGAVQHLYVYLGDPQGGEPRLIDRLRIPAGNPAAGVARLTVSLDARGVLRLHRGVLPSPRAASIREAERQPGWVHRLPMERRGTSDIAGWDPESGEH